MIPDVSDRCVSQPPGTDLARPGTRRAIALGENNPDLAALLCSLLDLQPDLQCTGLAATCAQVRDLHRAQALDGWLLDLALDDGSSLALLPALRQQQPQCVLLVVSGVTDSQLTAHALAHGADAVLAKDGNIEALLAALRRHLAQRQQPGAAAAS